MASKFVQLVPLAEILIPCRVIDFNYILLYHPKTITIVDNVCSIDNISLAEVIRRDPKATRFLRSREDIQRKDWTNLSKVKEELLFVLMIDRQKARNFFLVPYINKFVNVIHSREGWRLTIKENGISNSTRVFPSKRRGIKRH